MSQLRLKIQVNNLLQSRKVARAGFEPMTSSYSYWCSRPLSYHAMVYQLGFTYWFHLQAWHLGISATDGVSTVVKRSRVTQATPTVIPQFDKYFIKNIPQSPLHEW